MRRIATLGLLMLLAGCASAPPTTLLRLSSVSGASVVAAADTPITVAAVEIPPGIDRSALTTEASRNTLTVSRDARWAGPLGHMTTRVLAEDLALRLHGATVLLPGEAEPPGGARAVRVDMIRFLPVARTPDTHVALDADWQMLSPSGAVLHDGQSRIRVPTGPDPAEAARSMSTALGRLADQIAASFGHDAEGTGHR